LSLIELFLAEIGEAQQVMGITVPAVHPESFLEFLFSVFIAFVLKMISPYLEVVLGRHALAVGSERPECTHCNE